MQTNNTNQASAMNEYQLVALNIDILDVVSKLTGQEVVSSGTNTFQLEDKSCPFCSNYDCFKINLAEEPPYFKCFSCDARGDVTSFVSKLQKLSPSEALEFLKSHDFDSTEAQGLTTQPSREVEVAPACPKIQAIFNDAAKYYSQSLSDNKIAYVHQLVERKHSLESLENQQVGFSDGKLNEHLLKQGHSQENIQRSGLTKENGQDFFMKDCFIYPHFNEVGNVCTFTMKPYGHDYHYQLGKKFRLNGVLFYGENTLVDKQIIAIVEGENDLLSLLEAGWKGGVLATIGSLSKDQLALIDANKDNYRFITFFDDDDAGNKYRNKVMQLDFKHQQVSDYDGCSDVDEYLKSDGDLDALLSKAEIINEPIEISYPNFGIEDLDTNYDQCTDSRNANRLERILHGHAKYVHELGKWYIFNGLKWEEDKSGQVQEAAKGVSKLIHREADTMPYFNNPEGPKQEKANSDKAKQYGHALKAENIPTLKNMISACATKSSISKLLNDFDSHDNLLGMQNGVLNLDTGELLEPDPELLVTKVSNAAYNPEAKAPAFLAFLATALSNFEADEQKDIQEYLQRFAGASLYGEIKDRAFHFLYGLSGTGKSVFTNTLQFVLGDYACVLSPESLMDRVRGGDARSDLLAIKGARLVVAPEVSHKCKLNEDLMKRLTSAGDTLSVRPLYGEPVCFKSQATIILTGNHKPSITSGSDATWQRMRLVEFMHQIPREQQDKELPHKLEQEADGIFLWAYEGFKQWKEHGLTPPPVMEKLAREYQDEQSYLQNFIDDCCESNPEHYVETEYLWRAYDTWAQSVKYGNVGKRSFLEMLKQSDYLMARTSKCDQVINQSQTQHTSLKGLKVNAEYANKVQNNFRF